MGFTLNDTPMALDEVSVAMATNTGIDIHRSSNVNVTDSHITKTPIGIRCTDVGYLSVKGCSVTGGRTNGVSLYGSLQQATITASNFTQNDYSVYFGTDMGYLLVTNSTFTSTASTYYHYYHINVVNGGYALNKVRKSAKISTPRYLSAMTHMEK